MAQNYTQAAKEGAVPDSQYVYAYNRTGAAVVVNKVYCLNDNGTNASYDDIDRSDTDMDKCVKAMETADANCRHVVATKALADGEWGRWLIKGRAKVKAASVTGTVAKGGFLTSYSDTDGTSPAVGTAGQLTARPRSGTGGADGYKAPLKSFGRVMEAVSTAGEYEIAFDGDGHWIGFGA